MFCQRENLIQGDEHFECTFSHLEGLRCQISGLVTEEVFLGHPLRLPITLDDNTRPLVDLHKMLKSRKRYNLKLGFSW